MKEEKLGVTYKAKSAEECKKLEEGMKDFLECYSINDESLGSSRPLDIAVSAAEDGFTCISPSGLVRRIGMEARNKTNLGRLVSVSYNQVRVEIKGNLYTINLRID